MRQVNLRLSEELLEKVEMARGQVPRERWLRMAVEQALGDDTHQRTQNSPRPTGAASPRGASAPSTPAEQPSDGNKRPGRTISGFMKITPEMLVDRDHQPGPNVENVRSSAQAKRDVKPIPKGK